MILADPTSYRGLALCQLWHTASHQIVIFTIPAGKQQPPGPTVTLTTTHGIRARARKVSQSQFLVAVVRAGRWSAM